VPPEVEDLITTVRCRWAAVDLGFEKMTLKDKTLRCYSLIKMTPSNLKSDVFKNILQVLQTSTNKGKIKTGWLRIFC
jgi:transcription-repair coupling factor (superfamily II helicase)